MSVWIGAITGLIFVKHPIFSGCKQDIDEMLDY